MELKTSSQSYLPVLTKSYINSSPGTHDQTTTLQMVADVVDVGNVISIAYCSVYMDEHMIAGST